MHPLCIEEVRFIPEGRAIGVTLCPDEFQRNGGEAHWSRDLDADVAAIRQWQAALVVSLITETKPRRK